MCDSYPTYTYIDRQRGSRDLLGFPFLMRTRENVEILGRISSISSQFTVELVYLCLEDVTQKVTVY